MKMGMFELIDLMSSKNGDELFEKVTAILEQHGIVTHNEDGSYKDLYTVCCEVSALMNKGQRVKKID
jgi:hypothetical protein